MFYKSQYRFLMKEIVKESQWGKNHVQFDRRLWRDCRMQYLSAHHKFHILLTCSMPPLQMLLMRVQDVSAS
jgi:hypothetical protein